MTFVFILDTGMAIECEMEGSMDECIQTFNEAKKNNYFIKVADETWVSAQSVTAITVKKDSAGKILIPQTGPAQVIDMSKLRGK